MCAHGFTPITHDCKQSYRHKRCPGLSPRLLPTHDYLLVVAPYVCITPRKMDTDPILALRNFKCSSSVQCGRRKSSIMWFQYDYMVTWETVARFLRANTVIFGNSWDDTHISCAMLSHHVVTCAVCVWEKLFYGNIKSARIVLRIIFFWSYLPVK